MGNRSRYVAVTAAAATAAVVSARRNARLRRVADGVRQTILPTHVADRPTDLASLDDESHAPGHRHLGRAPGSTPARERARAGRMAQYAKGMRHRVPDR
jgi:hypothetical protein